MTESRVVSICVFKRINTFRPKPLSPSQYYHCYNNNIYTLATYCCRCRARSYSSPFNNITLFIPAYYLQNSHNRRFSSLERLCIIFERRIRIARRNLRLSGR